MRLLIVFLLCSFRIYAQQADYVLYVAQNGNDQSAGSMERPLKSLNAALLKVAELKGGAVSILLRGGTYEVDKSIVIGKYPQLKGLTISNYKEEKVLISGGRKIPVSAVKKSAAAIYQVDLKKAGIADYGKLRQHGHRNAVTAPMELFLGDQAMELARWPNKGFLPIGLVKHAGLKNRNSKPVLDGAVFRYITDRPDKWKKADQVWITGFLANGFANDHLPVKSISAERKEITLAATTAYGLKMTDQEMGFQRFFFYNVPEELDSAGEYYLDRSSGILSFYHTEVLSDDLIVSMCSTPIISLINSENVVLAGLEIGYGRDMGIYAEGTKNIKIQHCKVMNLGTVGIGLGKYTADPAKFRSYEDLISYDHNSAFVINSCKIYNTGAGGVFMTGGDRKNLIPAGNRVENTEIFNYARRNWASAPAVFLGGVGAIIKNCFIHDSEGQAIMYWGNNHEIAYNQIKDVLREINDQGAVYTGRDRSSTGTRIHHNLFENLISPKGYMVAAVYIDDGSGGIQVDSNIFVNSGSAAGKLRFGAIHINGGGNNTFRGNTFVDCRLAVSMTSWTAEKWRVVMGTAEMAKKLKTDVNFGSALYLKRYPFLKGLAAGEYKPGPNQFINSQCINVDQFSSNKAVLDRHTVFSKAAAGRNVREIKQFSTSGIGLKK